MIVHVTVERVDDHVPNLRLRGTERTVVGYMVHSIDSAQWIDKFLMRQTRIRRGDPISDFRVGGYRSTYTPGCAPVQSPWRAATLPVR